MSAISVKLPKLNPRPLLPKPDVLILDACRLDRTNANIDSKNISNTPIIAFYLQDICNFLKYDLMSFFNLPKIYAHLI